jgi:hypothetical protein
MDKRERKAMSTKLQKAYAIVFALVMIGLVILEASE